MLLEEEEKEASKEIVFSEEEKTIKFSSIGEHTFLLTKSLEIEYVTMLNAGKFAGGF